ncbi:MAG: bifunctional pyr operon transcriptional regulator/uracil phosphoribosyltransferase PyrR [Acidobacteria bacterium]|nr:bifunctional pyr operon transcriptional regulator/uracil phosphoribosyltransferase PyrR [Acidobacteriota bacterium]
MKDAQQIMTATQMNEVLHDLAEQIVGRHPQVDEVALVGIRRRGAPLAHRLAEKVGALRGRKIPVGTLDITLYRDDLTTIAPNPVVHDTFIDFQVEGKVLILVDDVLYTGRTVRAALDSLIDYGRPRKVELAALIDRGHRELPIQADYVGRSVETREDQIVKVMLKEEDGVEQVLLVTQES